MKAVAFYKDGGKNMDVYPYFLKHFGNDFCFLLQTPLPEQDGPSQGSVNTIELVSSREMAYYMTLFDWDLFSCVQEVWCIM